MKIILEAPEMILGTVEEKLNEASGKSEKNYYIRGIFSTIGEKNKNGRTYPRHLWEREISKYQSEIRSNSVNSLMEYNHPSREYVDPILSVAKIVSLTIEGNKVIGKAKLLNDTNDRVVNKLKTLIDEGISIGVSSRGVGNVNSSGIVEEFKLVTYDIVPNPSDCNAYTQGINENIENGIVLSKDYAIDENTGSIVICNKKKCSTHDKQLFNEAVTAKFAEILSSLSSKLDK